MQHRLLLPDPCVHRRLGEIRLIALVVTVPAIAPQVDDHIVLEGLAILQRQLGGKDARLRIVAVDVQDWGFGHLGDVGAVGPAMGVVGVGRKADLIVDDDVDRSADGVAVETDHVQALGHDALSGE